ncbi:hypothetical protein HDE_11906 [Halotydeus destructor]|nr:hypothetical protein HDE_11906 [Halotydeus destructor]
MSEQKQLNVKNALNAVPSFRSEVDLQAASKHSSDTITMDEESLIISYSDLLPEVDYEECVTSANKVKVPNQCSEQCSEQASFTLDTKAQSEDGEDKNEEQKSEQETDSDDESDSDEASLSDETIQLEAGTTPSLGHDLEPPLVCKACGHCLLSNKGTSLNSNMHLSGHGVVGGADKKSACEYQVKLPELPVKTFSAISVFGCEMKPRAARPLPLRLPTQAPRRTLSTPLPAIPVLHGAHYGGDEDDDDMYHNDNVYEDIEFTEVSRNLEALLSPQHQLHVVRKENENVHANKGTSVANSEQVIEFINALALDDVTSKIKLTPPHGALASPVSAPARPAPLLAASVSSTQKQPTEQLVPIIAASTTDPGFK